MLALLSDSFSLALNSILVKVYFGMWLYFFQIHKLFALIQQPSDRLIDWDRAIQQPSDRLG